MWDYIARRLNRFGLTYDQRKRIATALKHNSHHATRIARLERELEDAVDETTEPIDIDLLIDKVLVS